MIQDSRTKLAGEIRRTTNGLVGQPHQDIDPAHLLFRGRRLQRRQIDPDCGERLAQFVVDLRARMVRSSSRTLCICAVSAFNSWYDRCKSRSALFRSVTSVRITAGAVYTGGALNRAIVSDQIPTELRKCMLHFADNRSPS